MNDHAQALYRLSAELALLLSKALLDEHAITGSALGVGQVSQNALAAHFQYALLFCALEKIQINQAVDDAYWSALDDALRQIIDSEARDSADKILGPMANIAAENEVESIKKNAYSPLAAYEGTSLANLDKGLEGTPMAVLATSVVKSFYAAGDHSAVADRVISLSFEGVKELFNKGGLV